MSQQTTQKQKPKHVQEKFMFLLSLIFIGGIAMYGTIPPSGYRDLAMVVYIVSVVFFLFKFPAMLKAK